MKKEQQSLSLSLAKLFYFYTKKEYKQMKYQTIPPFIYIFFIYFKHIIFLMANITPKERESSPIKGSAHLALLTTKTDSHCLPLSPSLPPSPTVFYLLSQREDEGSMDTVHAV